MIDVTGAGSRNDAHRVQLRLVNRAFERYVRYRRGRNEKNESRIHSDMLLRRALPAAHFDRNAAKPVTDLVH